MGGRALGARASAKARESEDCPRAKMRRERRREGQRARLEETEGERGTWPVTMAIWRIIMPPFELCFNSSFLLP